MKTFTMTEGEYSCKSEVNEGICILCGADAYSIEPDATEYECEECGERGVYGLEELLVMGLINFSEEDT